jgi:glycosyltransferase involved in cell wall biosynthesis|tara:strand:- start:13727 stop:14695 length:969 start_codon:yes stop_codon:yes gene_type:complete
MFDVIIPIHKTQPEFLKECIDSVINQDFEDFQCYMVDGTPAEWEGYKENREYLNEIVSTDERFHYHVENDECNYAGGARNQAISYGSHEYLVVLDSDDWLENNHLSIMKEAILEEINPNVAIWFGIVSHFIKIPLGQNGTYERRRTLMNRYYDLQFIHPNHHSLFLNTTITYPVGMVMKRSEFERAGGYDDTFPIGEDSQILVSILGNPFEDKVFRQVRLVDECSANYRTHENQTTQKGEQLKDGGHNDYEKYMNYDTKRELIGLPTATLDNKLPFVDEQYWKWLVSLDQIKNRGYLVVDKEIVTPTRGWEHLLEKEEEWEE